MNDRSPAAILLSIAAVERDTGLSKDTLRVWERRYGFPAPERDAAGERAYPLEQVQKLRLLKRLLDAGHRPGRIVPLSLPELDRLGRSTPAPVSPPRPAAGAPHVQAYLERIRGHDLRGLRDALAHDLLRRGVAGFVADVVAPLNNAVGDAWMHGSLEVFEEHLYTEAVQVVLRRAIAAIPDTRAGAVPRVLLATLPGEPHGLGLLMAEAMFALEGCDCVSLGVQTPLWDIVRAAEACRVQIVALGFTGCMNPNQVHDGLLELRAKLPPAVQLWSGGSAPVLHRRRVDGVLALASLDAIADELAQWRALAAGLRDVAT